MARPGDWHLVDLSDDPTPGEAWGVRALATAYGTIADIASDVSTIVDAANTTSQSGIWVGEAGDAFRSKLDTLPDDARKCADSYAIARDALTYWAGQVDDTQYRADTALNQARTAQADLDAARAAVASALASQAAASTNLTALTDISTLYQNVSPPAGVTVPTDWQLRQARNASATAAGQLSSARSSEADAQARLDAAKRLVQEAKSDYEDAARTVVSTLEDAKDAGVRADTWWESIYHSDAWTIIVAVVTVVVIVAAIVLSGGLALAILAVGSALLLANSLMAYAEGDISGGEFALDVILTVVPGGKLVGALGKGLSAATRGVTAAVRTGSVAARVTGVAARVRVAEDGVTEIAIKMKKGWTAEQVQAMITKIAQVNERNPVVAAVEKQRRNPTATRLWELAGRERQAGMDIDHILDLRLGGSNTIDNLQLLDRSVNRSFGAQIGNALRHANIAEDTPVRITISP